MDIEKLLLTLIKVVAPVDKGLSDEIVELIAQTKKDAEKTKTSFNHIAKIRIGLLFK